MNTHAACLTLSRSLSVVSSLTFSLFFLPGTHTNSIFSVIYEHTEIPFHPLCLSVCLSPSRLTTVKHWHLGWRSYHTFHSSTQRSRPVISVVGDTGWATICGCSCVCVRACVRADWDHRESLPSWFNMSSDSYQQVLSMFADWDKSVENRIDCGVYWNATDEVFAAQIYKHHPF